MASFFQLAAATALTPGIARDGAPASGTRTSILPPEVREEMLDCLRIQPGMRVVELGCGSAADGLLTLGGRVQALARLDLVDSCPTRLRLARQRAAGHGNVFVHEADPADWQPLMPADRVVMHETLSRSPASTGIIANARRMLAPGGLLGAVDLYLPWQAPGLAKWFWRRRHGRQGLHLSDEHLDELRGSFAEHWFSERKADRSCASILQAPHYLFIGRR
jgi:S-adenosylmethionine-diacylgycerolhomoserine-N-methlytransferase